MQFRNRVGQFAGSYWKSLSRNQKQAAVAFLLNVVVVLMILTHQFVSEVVMREASYIAAPRAYAAEYIAPKPVKTMDEVLQSIADCESGIRKGDGSAVPGSGRQRGKDGKPVMNVNDTGSLDVGWAQINLEFHYKEIARLKLDVVSSEEDNKKFAEILYKREGTQPWSASRSCWDR